MTSSRTYSVARSMEALAKEFEITLDRLSGGLPQDGGDDDHASFTATEAALRAWCRRNEKLVADRRIEGVEVYAGFERLSRIQGVQRRFVRIGRAASGLWLFGESDYDPAISEAQIVDVGGGPLAREWFLLVYADRFKTLLCARDLDGFAWGRPTHARRFEGLKTHHPRLIETVREALQAIAAG